MPLGTDDKPVEPAYYHHDATKGPPLDPPSCVLGIDPGLSGGLAVVGSDGFVECCKMPPTEKDVFTVIWGLTAGGRVSRAYIEKVHSMPHQGVASMFTFGMNYGLLRGFLLALEVPFEVVSPGVWQRAMGCLSKGNKNVTKARAQELYPALGKRITHATADALLIATYGLRQR